MDLLAVYTSDEEKENEAVIQFPKRQDESLPNRAEHKQTFPHREGKRRKISSNESCSNYQFQCQPMPLPTVCTALPSGRYVSKKERAALASSSSSDLCSSESFAAPSASSFEVLGSISDANLPSGLMMRLVNKGGKNLPKGVPKKQSIIMRGHSKAVNAVRWSPTHGHLLASGGMDGAIYIWNVWNGVNQQKARMFNFNNTAITDIQWAKQGLYLLSCGYDEMSRLVNVETGSLGQLFCENQMVSVIKFHPHENDLFLSGGGKGTLRLWDIRANKVAIEFSRGLGPILDADFNYDGTQFACSSDVSQSNASDKSIVVWDVRTQIPLSKQVYVEAYTCPCIRYHPIEATFVAQSNGNYIALFSSNPPFKLNKFKRFEGHQVSGFPIRCDFSKDGAILCTGSADGCICFYNFRSAMLIRRILAGEHASIDVAFHDILPSVLASCSWDGSVSVFE